MSYLPLIKGSGFASLLSSSFEAEALPLEDVSSFEEAYSSFKAAHPKADHYPYALRVKGYEKSNDDGEPGGSAGKAMLIMLEERSVDCCLLVVARYFGGTKLGVGRLKRCFLDASKEALDKAVYGEEKDVLKIHLSLSYSRYEEVKRLSKKHGYELKDEQFAMQVETNLYADGTIPFDENSLLLRQEEILSQEHVKQVRKLDHDPIQ